MTISTQSSAVTVLGNGLSTTFTYPFVADSASDIEVLYTAADSSVTVISPSSYTLVINSAATGAIWGIGGSVTYPLSGSPIASGTSLTIRRILPLTQTITISGQGDFAPQVIEEMGDTLMMQIQQVAARTGQIRGTWATAIVYNFGDIVQDGANGNNSLNYYMCAIANTSTTWAADLAAGDWSLAVQAGLPSVALPLAVTNGGTGVTTSTGTGSTVLSASPTLTGTVSGAIASWSGSSSAASFSPTGASIPTNGIYLPASNQVGIAANSALAFSAGYYTGTGTPVNSIEALNCGAGFYPVFQATGSDTNISVVYTSKGNVGHVFNTNGPQTGSPATQVIIDHTASANNYISLTGSSGAAAAVQITAKSLGSVNNNVGINYTTRGNGAHTFTTGGTSSLTALLINHVAAAVNPLIIAAGASGAGPKLSTLLNNAPINFQPAGSGTLNSSAPLVFTDAADGVIYTQGANGRVGTFTLAGTAAVTVNNTSIATSDAVVISLNTVGGTVGAQPVIKTLTAATGFTVAGSVSDVSTYNYALIKNQV